VSFFPESFLLDGSTAYCTFHPIAYITAFLVVFKLLRLGFLTTFVFDNFPLIFQPQFLLIIDAVYCSYLTMINFVVPAMNSNAIECI